jgi:hypothetical protein
VTTVPTSHARLVGTAVSRGAVLPIPMWVVIVAATVRGMSDERFEKLESALKALRTQVYQLDRQRRADRVRTSLDLVACTVAGTLFALTAASWVTIPNDDVFADGVITLWGMVPEGWQAVATLLLVLLLAVGTPAAFVGEAGRYTHIFFVVVALLAVVAIAFFVGQVEPGGWYAEETDVGTGRWLAGLACLFLAITHGARAGEH